MWGEVVDLALGDDGLLVATPDVYSHSVSAEGTLNSNAIRYTDEAQLVGGVIGVVNAEPGAILIAVS